MKTLLTYGSDHLDSSGATQGDVRQQEAELTQVIKSQSTDAEIRPVRVVQTDKIEGRIVVNYVPRVVRINRSTFGE